MGLILKPYESGARSEMVNSASNPVFDYRLRAWDWK